MKKTILTLSAILILIGCGGGGSSADTDKTDETEEGTPYVVDYSIPLEYDYNQDGSASQRLAPLYVNQYKEVQKKLNEIKNDSVEFYSVFSGYIGDLYRGTSSTKTIPIYAPSGESKSQIVTVNNGRVDYSSYKLKGDVDFNWEVDFDDLKLLSEAILNNMESFQYDVNGDGKVDTADVVDLVARFGNEIKSFDFYTTTGTKLDISSRTIEEEKSFAYGGAETQIMVVAKDRNGASGYESGLSDIEGVWYKKDGWVLKDEIPKLNNPKLSKSNREVSKTTITGWTFQNLGKASVGEYLQTHPYLVGWEFILNYAGANHPSGLKELLLPFTEEPLSGYIQLMETDIMGYFSTTDMHHPPQRTLNSLNYSYQVGALIDKKYRQIQIMKLESYYQRSSGDEIYIMIKHRYWWEMTIYYSPESYMLVGELTRNDGQEVKGKVTAGRIGPDKQAVYEGRISDDSFEVSPVSFGTYTLTYEDECSCISTLDENYVFESVDDGSPKFTIKDNKVKVKLQLLDKEGEPIGNKIIKIVAKSCVASNDEEKSFSSWTDYKGYVNFDNVPIGDYIVYADGKENSEIHFCEAYDGKLFEDKLWNIDVSFKGRSLTKEWHWKNIKIAGINEPLKTEYDSAYPFPYMHEHGGTTLVDTSFYDNADAGLILAYYPNGYGNGLIKKGYCIDTDWLAQLITDHGDTHLLCADESYIGADSIHTYLNATQEAAYLNYKRFTIQDTGRWINDGGSSSLTITFTPSH